MRPFAALAVLLLAACSLESPSPEMQAASRAYVDQLRAGDFRTIARDIDDSVFPDDLPAKLRQMASLFPAGEPREVRLVGWHIHAGLGAGTRTEHVFELDYGERRLLASVVLQERDGRRTLFGLNVYPQDANLSAAGAAGMLRNAAIAAAVAFLVIGCIVVVVLQRRGRRDAAGRD